MKNSFIRSSVGALCALLTLACVPQDAHAGRVGYNGPNRSAGYAWGPNRSGGYYSGPNRSGAVYNGPNRSGSAYSGPNRSGAVYNGPRRDAGYYSGPNRNVAYSTNRRVTYYHGPCRSYGVVYGYGYRGRGYYYGPVGLGYYYATPGVVFYPTLATVPATYTVVDAPGSASLDASVQNELAGKGYYKGAIDGDIGPASRAAISRYQADNGLKVTGTINNALLESLDLD